MPLNWTIHPCSFEAFNASKNRDYLLSVNKTSQLNQLFPDSPLRDISLLLWPVQPLKR
jgi:hypothetical protein